MNGLRLGGTHHVSALTARLSDNIDFYTRVLGLRLVKRSVNQDDPSMYHLFYADRRGSAGSDMTFFDFPRAVRWRPGANVIHRTTFRVSGDAALRFWHERLRGAGASDLRLTARDGRAVLDLTDPEGTVLSLVDDGGLGPRGVPREESGVPEPFQIQGLGYSGVTVAALSPTATFLTRGLGMREARTFEGGGRTTHVFVMPGFEATATQAHDADASPSSDAPETGPSSRATGAPQPSRTNDTLASPGVADALPTASAADRGPHLEFHVTELPTAPRARHGAGGVHHVALRVRDRAELGRWLLHLDATGYRNSGLIDRYYFQSVYITDPNGLIIELATDGPGFTTDESLDTLGERLALPPFLEPQRARIEANLPPLILPDAPDRRAVQGARGARP